MPRPSTKQKPEAPQLGLDLTADESLASPAAPKRVGRPPVEEPRQTRGVRMTAQEWATFQALGGGEWLRDMLAKAVSDGEKSPASRP